MENKYPVKTYGISYVCDDCRDTAVEYKEFKSESIDGKISYYYIHVCPKCGKEYRLNSRYPYSVCEPINDNKNKYGWWDIFKRNK